MKIAQDQQYKGEDWWEWSVWIDAEPEDLKAIDKVVWRLHPTFPEPEREVSNRSENFRLKTAGWGTFEIKADVIMNGGKRLKLRHDLELHYPDGMPAPE